MCFSKCFRGSSRSRQGLLTKAPASKVPWIQRLINSNVLDEIISLLDDGTLYTVLCHFPSFRKCVPQSAVKRVMFDLFGCMWKGYYDAYLTYFHLNFGEFKLGNGRSRGIEQARLTAACRIEQSVNVEGIWGATVKLSFPCDATQLDGYATLMVLRTLRAIESACTKGPAYFFPSEPEYGSFISSLYVMENARYVTVLYSFASHEWNKKFGTINNGRDPEAENILCWPALDDEEIYNPKCFEIWDIASEPSKRIWFTCLTCDRENESSICECSWHRCGLQTCPGNACRRSANDSVYENRLQIIPSIAKDSTITADLDVLTRGCSCDLLPRRRPRFLIVNRKGFDTVTLKYLSFKDCCLIADKEYCLSSVTCLLYSYTYLTSNIEWGGRRMLVVWKVKVQHVKLVWKDGYCDNICEKCYSLVFEHWLQIQCDQHGFRVLDLRESHPTPLLHVTNKDFVLQTGHKL